MAETAQKNLHTEIAVGITGTTGNVDPNNADSMQGKVFFCIIVGENAYDYEYNAEVIRMSRHEIKELYADKVFLNMIKNWKKRSYGKQNMNTDSLKVRKLDFRMLQWKLPDAC